MHTLFRILFIFPLYPTDMLMFTNKTLPTSITHSGIPNVHVAGHLRALKLEILGMKRGPSADKASAGRGNCASAPPPPRIFPTRSKTADGKGRLGSFLLPDVLAFSVHGFPSLWFPQGTHLSLKRDSPRKDSRHDSYKGASLLQSLARFLPQPWLLSQKYQPQRELAHCFFFTRS